MSPIKKGTKLTDNPKDLSTRVRLAKSDVEMLERCAETTGLSKSEIIRKGIERVYKEEVVPPPYFKVQDLPEECKTEFTILDD